MLTRCLSPSQDPITSGDLPSGRPEGEGRSPGGLPCPSGRPPGHRLETSSPPPGGLPRGLFCICWRPPRRSHPTSGRPPGETSPRGRGGLRETSPPPTGGLRRPPRGGGETSVRPPLHLPETSAVHGASSTVRVSEIAPRPPGSRGEASLETSPPPPRGLGRPQGGLGEVSCTSAEVLLTGLSEAQGMSPGRPPGGGGEASWETPPRWREVAPLTLLVVPRVELSSHW